MSGGSKFTMVLLTSRKDVHKGPNEHDSKKREKTHPNSSQVPHPHPPHRYPQSTSSVVSVVDHAAQAMQRRSLLQNVKTHNQKNNKNNGPLPCC